jgi:hypothetical protein
MKLPRFLSDHFPIMLACGDVHRSRKYFKFKNMWLKLEGFLEKVKQWWMSYSFQGSLSFILECKLKALKIDLKEWNEEVMLRSIQSFSWTNSEVLMLL